MNYDHLLKNHLDRLNTTVLEKLTILNKQIKSETLKKKTLFREKKRVFEELENLTKTVETLAKEEEACRQKSRTYHDAAELESDGETIMVILQRRCISMHKEEMALEEALQATENSLRQYRTSFKVSKNKKIDQHLNKALNEAQHEKSVQDVYIERLKIDTIYAEINLFKLVEQLRSIRGQQMNKLKSYSNLLKLLEKYQTKKIRDYWIDLLTFSTEERALEENIMNSASKNCSQVHEAKTCLSSFFLNCTRNNYHQILKHRQNTKTNFLFWIHNYISGLEAKLADAHIKQGSVLYSQLKSRADPIQQRGFKAEIKYEIFCHMTNKIKSLITDCAAQQEMNTSVNADYIFTNVKLFPVDDRTHENIKTFCDQVNNINKIKRRENALKYRLIRLQNQLETNKEKIQTTIDSKKALENELSVYDANRWHNFNVSGVDKNAVTAKDYAEQYEIVNKTDETQLQIKATLQTLSDLDSDLAAIREESNAVIKKIHAVNKKSSNIEQSEKANLAGILRQRHGLISLKTSIQKELDFVVSRRSCAINTFSNFHNNIIAKR